MTHAVRVRIGAAHWDITVNPNQADEVNIDLRTLTKTEQQKAFRQLTNYVKRKN